MTRKGSSSAPDTCVGKAFLRPYRRSDATAIRNALRDRGLLQWLAALPIPIDHTSLQEYTRFLADADVIARAICIGDEVIGIVSLGTELSFWLRRDMQGKGIGRWAVRCFLEQLPMGVQHVEACCLAHNTVSILLLLDASFEETSAPFKRFSFAHGKAMEFRRFRLSRKQSGGLSTGSACLQYASHPPC
ncbi:GNAT family N-acetyltransferase [Ruegeria lacuscaerulensis]|uniref:GNAT family N-acetyltransferase n=1 Tax=Ruegeria lacuscaerulensis TaxID=55218 RepID=UPI001479AE1A|nr:GNAT family protein [Ruegeria lacuscaerulensis]